jgi:uncharacterized damage-inducible protein DinB
MGASDVTDARERTFINLQEDPMTLQEIKLLHAFNSWADNRILDAVAAMPAGQAMQNMNSSHGSIHGTLVHLVGSEKIWLSRWTGKPDATFLSAADAPTVEAVKSIWVAVGFETAKFLSAMTDRKLQDTFTMKTSKGDTYTHLYWQAFQHMVDHCSYHRGQIVSLMRQQAATPPTTGLINFYRETAKLSRNK